MESKNTNGSGPRDQEEINQIKAHTNEDNRVADLGSDNKEEEDNSCSAVASPTKSQDQKHGADQLISVPEHEHENCQTPSPPLSSSGDDMSESDIENVDSGGDIKIASPTSFLATSSSDTSSDDDDEPDAKRRRSLGDYERAQELFQQKLVAISSNMENRNLGPQPSGSSTAAIGTHSEYWNNSPSNNFDPNAILNALSTRGLCDDSTAVAALPLSQNSDTSRRRSKDLFRDISDCTSISSISISSNSDQVPDTDRVESRRRPGQNLRTACEQDLWLPIINSDEDDSDADPPFDVEFEVASVSICSSNPIEDANSSSGLEDEDIPIKVSDWTDTVSDETENDADEELELDKSDDEVSTKDAGLGGVSDSELSDKDFWKCSQCNAKTNSPYLRYCLRCFRIRRNWLPKRPQPKGNGKRKAKRNSSQNRRHTSSEEEPAHTDQCTGAEQDPNANTASRAAETLLMMHRDGENSSLNFSINCTPEPGDVDTVDGCSSGPKSGSTGGPISSSGSSSLRPASSLYSNTSTEGTCDLDATDGSQDRIGSSSMPPPAVPQSEISAQILKDVLTRKPIKIKTVRKPPCVEEKESPVCSVCMVRDKDAAFVHGKTAHVYSCYNCADKILKKNGKCPICRKRILRVVKIINS